MLYQCRSAACDVCIVTVVNIHVRTTYGRKTSHLTFDDPDDPDDHAAGARVSPGYIDAKARAAKEQHRGFQRGPPP